MHGICPDHKWQRTRWKSHVFTVNTAAVCMETVFAFLLFTWSVACRGQGVPTTEAEDLTPHSSLQPATLQSTIIQPSVNISRFRWEQAIGWISVKSACWEKKFSVLCFVTGTCYIKCKDTSQEDQSAESQANFEAFTMKKVEKMHEVHKLWCLEDGCDPNEMRQWGITTLLLICL